MSITISFRYWIQLPVLGFILCWSAVSPVFAESQPTWTLQRSIERALAVAPEVRAAQASVREHQGKVQQAGAWPNPTIELIADDKLGIEDDDGGNDLRLFAFSQPLPFSGRLGYQKAMAGAQLEAARVDFGERQLLLESEVARRYHGLQLAAASLRLAEQRLELADKLQAAGRRREQAGELARLERLRLDLVRESAQQLLDKAEGKYNEMLGQYRRYLNLPVTADLRLLDLEPMTVLPELENLWAEQAKHPALRAANYRLLAAQAKVDLTRAERLPDPVISIFRERDFLNERRDDVTGVGLAVTVPLWDRKSGRLSAVRAEVDQEKYKLKVLERDLAGRLQQSYLHLQHLVEQGVHYRTEVFEPARQVFDLTRKAYTSGEVEILSLIDANNTYYDAHTRYLELLQEALLEAAELRLAAGHALISTVQEPES